MCAHVRRRRPAHALRERGQRLLVLRASLRARRPPHAAAAAAQGRTRAAAPARNPGSANARLGAKLGTAAQGRARAAARAHIPGSADVWLDVELSTAACAASALAGQGARADGLPGLLRPVAGPGRQATVLVGYDEEHQHAHSERAACALAAHACKRRRRTMQARGGLARPAQPAAVRATTAMPRVRCAYRTALDQRAS